MTPAQQHQLRGARRCTGCAAAHDGDLARVQHGEAAKLSIQVHVTPLVTGQERAGPALIHASSTIVGASVLLSRRL
ncbi:hypothetical protein [Cellulomonas humilata]|uniref:Uncharacterized protein n=1 Tax=Cellulomonas humilata TaxID=144055 RepID=A0ABU0EKM3_9CELL|nr:hypothetical protein [Cellulomonas humilata]MDQ0375841.1 hypothetical protein [Cellulomonas humilata]